MNAGCSESVKSSTAHGTVMLNGQPLAGAEVQFIPKSDNTLGAHTTTTGPDGTFTLKVEAVNTPLRPGSYLLVVNKWSAGSGGGMDAMKNEVPELYRTQATTPLKAEIQDGENILSTFFLESKR